MTIQEPLEEWFVCMYCGIVLEHHGVASELSVFIQLTVTREISGSPDDVCVQVSRHTRLRVLLVPKRGEEAAFSAGYDLLL